MTKRNTGSIRYAGEGQLTDEELKKIRADTRLGIVDTVRLFDQDWNWYIDNFSNFVRQQLRGTTSQTTDNDVTFKQDKETVVLCRRGQRPQFWMLGAGSLFEKETFQARLAIKAAFPTETGGAAQFADTTRTIDGVKHRMPDSVFMEKVIIFAMKTIAGDMKRHNELRTLGTEHQHEFKISEKLAPQPFKAGKSPQKARHKRMWKAMFVVSGRKQFIGARTSVLRADDTHVDSENWLQYDITTAKVFKFAGQAIYYYTVNVSVDQVDFDLKVADELRRSAN